MKSKGRSKEKFKNMGRRLALAFIILMFSCVVGASLVPLDRMKHQTLIYGEDIVHDVKLFCEFAPEHLLSGAVEEQCHRNNPDMRMIRNGETLYPWRRYSGGKDGIILECPPHGMNRSSCTNGHRLYSVCEVSCPAGFVNTTKTIECQLKPPLENVSAEWPSINFCQSVRKDESTSGTKKEPGSKHDINGTWTWYIVGAVLFIVIVLVVAFVTWRRGGFEWCSLFKGRSPGSSTNTSSSSVARQDPVGNGNGFGISDLHIFPFNNFASGRSDEVELQQIGYGEGNAETPLNEAPALSEDEEDDEMRGATCASKLSEEEPFIKDESRDGSCTTLIKKLELLKQTEIQKIGSVLEYCHGRKKEHTLYGYILENWEVLRFTSKQEVEVCQNRQDYRNGDKPVEFFLNCLMSNGVSIREVLVYFHDQGAKSAKNVLLEFHNCECCMKEFGSISSH